MKTTVRDLRKLIREEIKRLSLADSDLAGHLSMLHGTIENLRAGMQIVDDQFDDELSRGGTKLFFLRAVKERLAHYTESYGDVDLAFTVMEQMGIDQAAIIKRKLADLHKELKNADLNTLSRDYAACIDLKIRFEAVVGGLVILMKQIMKKHQADIERMGLGPFHSYEEENQAYWDSQMALDAKRERPWAEKKVSPEEQAMLDAQMDRLKNLTKQLYDMAQKRKARLASMSKKPDPKDYKN